MHPTLLPDMTDSPTASESPPGPAHLKRVAGLFDATLLGLGSILGTGVFVSLLMVHSLAGAWTPAVIMAAAVVAMCNGLSSAQLAAAHPVAGGTYEYGHRYLTPSIGFAAGWLFLTAKSASAATAALGVAWSLKSVLPQFAETDERIAALCVLVVLTLLVLGGLRQSTKATFILVAVVLVSLILVTIGFATSHPGKFINRTTPEITPSWSDLFEACALMFVAYTGYGRVATMGEEIENPRRNIPIAVVMTVMASLVVYVMVGWSLHRYYTVGKMEEFRDATSLVDLSGGLALGGAFAAMIAVLLNLLLGLSRVVLAMSRRGDAPAALSKLNESRTSPNRAVLVVALIIAGLVLIGDIFKTWSLSAFTVLVYYACANLCALAQPPEDRRMPRIVSVVGLAGCLYLCVWIEPTMIAIGSGGLLIGFALRFVFHLVVARTAN